MNKKIIISIILIILTLIIALLVIRSKDTTNSIRYNTPRYGKTVSKQEVLHTKC